MLTTVNPLVVSVFTSGSCKSKRWNFSHLPDYRQLLFFQGCCLSNWCCSVLTTVIQLICVGSALVTVTVTRVTDCVMMLDLWPVFVSFTVESWWSDLHYLDIMMCGLSRVCWLLGCMLLISFSYAAAPAGGKPFIQILATALFVGVSPPWQQRRRWTGTNGKMHI